LNAVNLLASLLIRLIKKSTPFQMYLDEIISEKTVHYIEKNSRIITPDGHPGLGVLWDRLKDIDIMRWDLKVLGLELARVEFDRRRTGQLSEVLEASRKGITSALVKQSDFSECWFRYWCQQLHLEPIYHRKIWEYAFVLQALFESGKIVPECSGIGFGCGQEPIASYFASKTLNVLVTDLAPDKSKTLGWLETGQHTSSLDLAFYQDIVSRETFNKRTKLEYVDMNDIPAIYNEQFDFCWSICALEHLGSISKGLDFVINSTKVLKSGGVAIHTTEYNINSGPTIDNWPTVLFQKEHLDMLSQKLNNYKCRMLKLDYSTGEEFLDKFIDLPPYAWDQIMKLDKTAHLKLSIDGIPSTCVGIIVIKE